MGEPADSDAPRPPTDDAETIRSDTGTFARVTGRVQGVNYRASARDQAGDLGLTGWVRNTGDGAVELLIVGEGPAVDALVRWCRNGPRRAVVDDVEIREVQPQELAALPASGFEIRR